MEVSCPCPWQRTPKSLEKMGPQCLSNLKFSWMDTAAGVAGVALGLSVFVAWLSSLKPSAGTHEDGTLANAIEYLLWIEANGNQVGRRGVAQPFNSKFRHMVRTKKWSLVRDADGVIAIQAPPLTPAGLPRLLIPKSKIPEVLAKYHVREGTHTKARRCFNLVFSVLFFQFLFFC